jgi:hypothetical protein
MSQTAFSLVHPSYLRPGIAPLHVVDESPHLMHAFAVKPREPLLKAGLHSPECGRPEDHASRNQERGPDRAGKQEPSDPGDNQKDAEFCRCAVDSQRFLINIGWLSHSELAAVGSRPTHVVPLFDLTPKLCLSPT